MSNIISIIKQPLYGSVIWDGNDFKYTPKEGFSGTDYYIYSVTTGSSSEIKTNYINTTNRPPSAGDVSITADASVVSYININNYANDPDDLIHTLKIVELSKTLYGIASFNDNVISYQPNGFNSKEVFTYKISDGQYSSTATVEVNIINGINSQIPDYILNSLNSLEGDLTYISLQSGGWQSSFTLLCSKSAFWDSIDPARYNAVSNIVEAYSADWNRMGDNKDLYVEAYNLLQTKSGYWNNTIDIITNITNIYSGDSAKWESSYNLLCGTSATWDQNIKDTASLSSFYYSNSANWENTYLLVSGNSANWDKIPLTNLLSTYSGDWQNSYSILCSNSSKWDDSYTNINAVSSLFSSNSASWDTTYSLVCAKSAEWDTRLITSYLTAHSGDWETSYSLLCTGSGDWYANISNFIGLSTNYDSNSANWNSTYTTVCASSSLWDTTLIFSHLTAHSGDWTSAYSLVCSGSAKWDENVTNFELLTTNYSSYSGNWENVYNTVCASSAKWDTTPLFTYLSTYSGDWVASYSVVTSGSADWNNLIGYFSALSTDYNSNSGNWNSVYSTVCSTSASWDITDITSYLSGVSSDWTSAYNTVCASSAGWNSVGSLFSNLSTDYISHSGNWETTYSFVCANSSFWDVNEIFTLLDQKSGSWDAAYSVVTAGSGSWNSLDANFNELSSNYNSNSGYWYNTYNLVTANSSDWDYSSTATTVQLNSADWIATYTVLTGSSSNWNSSYNTLTGLTSNFASSSAGWESAYTLVSGNSGSWGDVTAFTTLTSNSAKWNSVYTSVCGNSSTWNSVSSYYTKYDPAYNLLSSTSADWNVTYSTVTANSGKWESVYSTVNTYSGKWLSGGTDVNFTTNDLIVSGNAVFYGSLTAEGETTQLNTEIVATSSFSIVNTGFVDALRVTKTQTTGAIADFTTNGSSVLYVSPNSKVGINTNAPTEALTVVGNISASGTIYGSTPYEYTVFTNNSANYETAYTYVSQTSASIDALTGAKGSYDTAYTYVTSNSSSFVSINENNSNYLASFNIVSSQSGNNFASYTFLTGNSAKVGTDLVYRSLSGKYEDASTYISSITSSQAQINFIFDGGGAVIDSGSFGMVQIPYNCVITEWTMLADVATIASIQVLSSDYNSYPTYVLISGIPNMPTLTNAAKASNGSTLTDWLTSINADTILKFKLVSNNAATSITLGLKCTKY